MKRIFITGISTEVGKTLASAICVEALQADYWKPVQAGDLDHSDSEKVRDWISNTRTKIHPNSYALERPMSPHAAAALEGVEIDLTKIQEPDTKNHLVIEGAGGLLVPLNGSDTIADLIRPEYQVILVSRHYLGSINHTLLSIECLRRRTENVHILFNGASHPSTESVILDKTGLPLLGRIDEESEINPQRIRHYADLLKPKLLAL